jgi:hypothetical protein
VDIVIAAGKAVFTFTVGLDDGVPAVLFGQLTVILPVAFTLPQPPVKGIVYEKLPATVGVPLIVIKSADQEAVTPAGKPVGVPIPVAPVVDIVIAAGKAVFTFKVGLDDGVPAVLFGHELTVMFPVAFTLPQPPVKGIVYE